MVEAFIEMFIGVVMIGAFAGFLATQNATAIGTQGWAILGLVPLFGALALLYGLIKAAGLISHR